MKNFVDHLRADGFIPYVIESPEKTVLYGGKEGCHKIVLLSGTGEINYDHQIYKFDGPVLLISKPGTRCNWLLTSTSYPSYVCVFKEAFLENDCFSWINQCDQSYPCNQVFKLTSDQETFLRSIFFRMIAEQKTSYPFKRELLQNQICILIHTVHRMTPLNTVVASTSIPLPSTVFLELIELQFPLQGQILHFN